MVFAYNSMEKSKLIREQNPLEMVCTVKWAVQPIYVYSALDVNLSFSFLMERSITCLDNSLFHADLKIKPHKLCLWKALSQVVSLHNVMSHSVHWQSTIAQKWHQMGAEDHTGTSGWNGREGEGADSPPFIPKGMLSFSETCTLS